MGTRTSQAPKSARFTVIGIRRDQRSGCPVGSTGYDAGRHQITVEPLAACPARADGSHFAR